MNSVWRIGHGAPPATTAGAPWMTALDAAAAAWRLGTPTSRTSGTTGDPVLHAYHPDAVRASALATARHFGLENKGLTAWSALPASGTGGSMMVWRTLILDWDLTVSKPAAAPVAPPARSADGRYGFAVATPMQARHLMESGQLQRFHLLLLGGGPLSPDLEEQLHREGTRCGCALHHGFGMTETLTHIATRPLGSPRYLPLPGVSLRSNAAGALIVDAPGRGVHQLVTQDAIAWDDGDAPGAFRWLGRLDDVINSGGLKVHPAALERELSAVLDPVMKGRRWYVTGRADAQLGERIAVVVEGKADSVMAAAALEALSGKGATRPRDVEFVSRFEETDTGKVRRKPLA